MSIEVQFSRIETNRNTIRAKLVELGLATNTDKLDVLAAAIEGLVNQGAVSVTVQEGDTYTIPAGYHNGSGTVSGVSGGGNYNLQSKTATPTKKQQSVTPDSGYYGLSDVTIAPIPDAYQNVTSVTAGAGDVLTGKVYVTKDGVVTTGTMANNGAVSKTLDATTITYTIPKGYHNGSGKVTIALETKSVIPTKSQQKITPTSGKVLSEVAVEPIPDAYQDVTSVTATAEDVLTGKTVVDAEGNVVEGAMADHGTVNVALNPNRTIYTFAEGYYSGDGRISVAATADVVTPNKTTQVVKNNTQFLTYVTVNPIPDAYQDVTAVDAVAGDVLDGKKIVAADGAIITGSMANNGDVSNAIDGLTVTSVTIAAGYTTGGIINLTDDIEQRLAAI